MVLCAISARLSVIKKVTQRKRSSHRETQRFLCCLFFDPSIFMGRAFFIFRPFQLYGDGISNIFRPFQIYGDGISNIFRPLQIYGDGILRFSTLTNLWGRHFFTYFVRSVFAGRPLFHFSTVQYLWERRRRGKELSQKLHQFLFQWFSVASPGNSV